MSGKIPVVELFGPTIQGEGLMTGTFSHFLRTGGCPLRCAWCDSMYAVDPHLIKRHAQWGTTAEIINSIDELPHAPYVTLTGGDPCIHKGLGDVVTNLNGKGMRVAVETQGTVQVLENCEWLHQCDVITISPKPPSSGNEIDGEELARWIGKFYRPGKNKFKLCIKVVIFTDEDLQYALHLYEYLSPKWAALYYDAFYFTTGTLSPMEAPSEHSSTIHALVTLNGYSNLADSLLQSNMGFNERTFVGCQQHVLLWPGIKKGV